MPALNDLTPEEEAMFAQHGVPSAGPGGEPIAEPNPAHPEDTPNAPDGAPPPPQPAPVDPNAPEPAPQAPPPPQPAPTEPGSEPAPGEVGSRRRADGTFKSAEELEADRQVLMGQQSAPQAQAPAPAPQAQQPDNRMVPIAALHEARQRTAALAQQMQTLTARTNMLLAGQRGPEQPEMPDITQDPAGFILALDQRLRAFEETRAEETQNRQIDNALEQDEMLFAQTVPDYEQASDHYIQSRARELAAFHPPEAIYAILTNEARTIAQNAWQRGMSPAQMVYGLAQARGYTPGQQPAPAPQPQAQPAPVPQAQAPTPGGPSAAAVVAAINNGQAASRSLSGGAGGVAAQTINAEALLAMSDEEFERTLQLGSRGADARFANAMGS